MIFDIRPWLKFFILSISPSLPLTFPYPSYTSIPSISQISQLRNCLTLAFSFQPLGVRRGQGAGAETTKKKEMSYFQVLASDTSSWIASISNSSESRIALQFASLGPSSFPLWSILIHRLTHKLLIFSLNPEKNDRRSFVSPAALRVSLLGPLPVCSSLLLSTCGQGGGLGDLILTSGFEQRAESWPGDPVTCLGRLGSCFWL